MSFTSGPWEVVRHSHVDGELWLSVNQHADTDGMKEWVAEIKYLTTDPQQQWANARLIAAAPELLQALHEVIGDCYYLDNPGGTPRCTFCQELDGEPHDPDCTMQYVLAATAKAEGR